MASSPNMEFAPSHPQKPPMPSLSAWPEVTPEARRYALRELARRAGLAREFFQKWTIEITPTRTSVSLTPEAPGKIHFAHENSRRAAGQPIPVARAGPFGKHVDASSPDLVLPFCESVRDPGMPLYGTEDDGSITCRLDLLRSISFTLARVEEILCATRDEHGRFPSSASVAARDQFLERPILDEHALAFQQVVRALLPAWLPEKRELRVKLTHDIDDIGMPFSLSASVAHGIKRLRPGAALRDFLSCFSATEPAGLALVRRLADLSAAHGRTSAVYWKGSPRGPYDSGYDPAHPKVQKVIESLRARGFELGVHPGYSTFGDRSGLGAEITRLKEALHADHLGGRQHYLRWSPDTWLDWEACGLHYDSSLGFADHFGFRAGTAWPYRPWSIRENRELGLLEIPLILMDCTPVKYMRLRRSLGLERIQTLLRRMEKTGGVFTLLWHNMPLMEKEYDGWYEAILRMIAGVKDYPMPHRADELW